MNEMLQSIILGIVQGLTEFLPISSSAHLNLFPWIFGWDKISESFDVALHFGTLLAICLFFWKDWIELIKGGFITGWNWLQTKLHTNKGKNNFSKIQNLDEKTKLDGKIFWYLVLATIPAGILSLILDKIAGKIIGDNLTLEMALIALALVIMGIVLYIVDKKSKAQTSYDKISKKQAVLVGVSQAIAAAFPGVSRSGITMTVARALKIDREGAAKFSFLLAAPIVAAAVIFDIGNFTFSLPFFIGILASFLSGILVIQFLMDYLKKGSFKIFAFYRILLGVFVLAILLFRG